MGAGLFKNGRYQPITPIAGSWQAQQAAQRVVPSAPHSSDWLPTGVPKVLRDHSTIAAPKGRR
jgi:hypothetical protein